MKPLLALLFLLTHFHSWAQDAEVAPESQENLSTTAPALAAEAPISGGPKCDIGTAYELQDSLFSMTCWSAGSFAWDDSCKKALAGISGTISAGAGISGSLLTDKWKQAARNTIDYQANKMSQHYKSIGREDLEKKVNGFADMPERKRDVLKIAADGEASWKAETWSRETRQANLLSRLEKIAQLSGDSAAVARIGGTRIALRAAAWVSRIQWGLRAVSVAAGVSAVGLTVAAYAGAAVQVGKMMTGTVPCETPLPYAYEGKPYVDLDPDASCKPSYGFPVGPNVKAFISLSPRRQADAMSKNPHLCSYFTEYVARLKETNKKLLKTLHDVQFTDRPVCGDNGSVSFKIKDGDKELEYSSVMDPQSKKVSRYEVKTKNPSDMDQFTYQMQIEKGDAKVATVEFNNRLRQTQKVTPDRFDALLVQDPAYFRGFQHYRRLDYWTPQIANCCAEKDQSSCFNRLNFSIPRNSKEITPAIPGATTR